MNPFPIFSKKSIYQEYLTKGCLLILSFWTKAPDWYNSLCTNAQPTASSNTVTFDDKPDWLISYTLFMLSFVPVFPYVQKRSTSGWRFQRVQAAAWFEDSSIKRGCEGKLVEGQWSREKELQNGTRLTGHVSDCESASHRVSGGFPLTWGWGLGLFWTPGMAERKQNVVPQSSARIRQGRKQRIKIEVGPCCPGYKRLTLHPYYASGTVPSSLLYYCISSKIQIHGNSLAVQRLGLRASTIGDRGSTPGWGTKDPTSLGGVAKK